jgi:hypothetical protein
MALERGDSVALMRGRGTRAMLRERRLQRMRVEVAGALTQRREAKRRHQLGGLVGDVAEHSARLSHLLGLLSLEGVRAEAVVEAVRPYSLQDREDIRQR